MIPKFQTLRTKIKLITIQLNQIIQIILQIKIVIIYKILHNKILIKMLTKLNKRKRFMINFKMNQKVTMMKFLKIPLKIMIKSIKTFDYIYFLNNKIICNNKKFQKNQFLIRYLRASQKDSFSSKLFAFKSIDLL